jgi:hypothetical protein
MCLQLELAAAVQADEEWQVLVTLKVVQEAAAAHTFRAG